MRLAPLKRVTLSPIQEDWPADAAVKRDKPLSPQIYSLLRAMIVEGRLSPGSALKEPAIAQHLQVSRTPVREALLRLQHDGLIELRPQSGTFVAAIDKTRVEEGMIVREALETRAAAIATAKITDRGLADLRFETDLMAGAAKSGDRKIFIEADDRFHRLIVDASGFSHIGDIIDRVNAQLDRIRYMSAKIPKRPQIAVREHHLLIDRLATGDANGSAAALQDHLTSSWVFIRDILNDIKSK